MSDLEVTSNLPLISLFDALPDAVFVIQPVHTSDKSIGDFEITFSNKVTDILSCFSESIKGKRLRKENVFEYALTDQIFIHSKAVLQTGESKVFEYFNNGVNQFLQVKLIPFQSGILSIVQSLVSDKREKLLLNNIMNATDSNIVACEAIRNVQEEVIDLQLIKVNQVFADAIGIAIEQAAEHTIHSLTLGLKDTDLVWLSSQVINTRKSVREIVFCSGQLQGWYEVSIKPLGNNSVIQIFTDITVSKQNSLALEETVLNLQRIIDHSQTAISIYEPVLDGEGEMVDLRIKAANLATATYFQKEPQALIGTLLSKWVPFYKTDGTFDIAKQVMATGQEHRFETHYQAHGIDSWTDVLSKKVGNDLVVSSHDFTPIKKLQQQLQESVEELKASNEQLLELQQAVELSAAQLKAIIDTSQAGLYTLYPVRNEQEAIVDFRLEIVNPTIAKYFNQVPKVLIGDLLSKWFPAYKHNGLFEIYVEAFEHNKAYQFDFHYEDNLDLYLNIVITKIGEQLLVALTDHTAIKKIQLQLEVSIQELKRSNESLEQFAYAASHDLQEPLRKISTNIDKLEKSHADILDDEAYGYIERIKTVTKRMRRLIKDLLIFAEVGSGQNSNEQVNLSQLVQEVVNDLEVAIQERDGQIHCTGLGTIKGDSIQLQQLFQNLISNSLKYSRLEVPPVINITATTVIGREIGLQVSKQEEQLKYSVITLTDNGQGFSDIEAKQIFKIFQRLPQHRSDHSGSGIGLATVKRVVENHKGYITATGIPDKGATFKIFLPFL